MTSQFIGGYSYPLWFPTAVLKTAHVHRRYSFVDGNDVSISNTQVQCYSFDGWFRCLVFSNSIKLYASSWKVHCGCFWLACFPVLQGIFLHISGSWQCPYPIISFCSLPACNKDAPSFLSSTGRDPHLVPPLRYRELLWLHSSKKCHASRIHSTRIILMGCSQCEPRTII